MAAPWIHGFGGALVLSGLIAASSAGQTIAYGEPLPRPGPAALEDGYRLRLRSAWPQLRSGEGNCLNGGDEVVEGRLTRTGDRTYAGSFARRTRLLFCGSHGEKAGACELILDGEGRVDLRAVVLDDEASPSGRTVQVAWDPAAGHAATVRGACPAGFKEQV
ncbi:MAG: hypothetical protein ACREMX_08915, partial [Gemmatimonadales bacterium]